jgi:outer membrane receptor protein involved in Fe transport
MTDDDELQELREQTDVGTRIQNVPDDVEDGTLEKTIVTLLDEVESGTVSKTLSLRDNRLAALIRGLEETDDLDDVGLALQNELGRDADPDMIDRSEVLRLAVRIGLQEAAPEIVEIARDAQARHASQQF